VLFGLSIFYVLEVLFGLSIFYVLEVLFGLSIFYVLEVLFGLSIFYVLEVLFGLSRHFTCMFPKHDGVVLYIQIPFFFLHCSLIFTIIYLIDIYLPYKTTLKAVYFFHFRYFFNVLRFCIFFRFSC